MTVRRWISALVAAGFAVAASISLATAATGTKQRVAIIERVSLTGGKSTFELIPLSPGPLVHDIGTVEPGGDFSGFITRNGLRIQLGSGSDNLTGSKGTVRLTAQIEHVPIVGGYYVDSGTWNLSAGTGAYAGLSGGGRFEAVVLPSGRILARNEGFTRPS